MNTSSYYGSLTLKLPLLLLLLLLLLSLLLLSLPSLAPRSLPLRRILFVRSSFVSELLELRSWLSLRRPRRRRRREHLMRWLFTFVFCDAMFFSTINHF